MRKDRFELKKYRIGKSGGLRLFYLVVKEKQKVIPVYIYKKGKMKDETQVTNNVKRNIKLIVKEMTEK